MSKDKKNEEGLQPIEGVLIPAEEKTAGRPSGYSKDCIKTMLDVMEQGGKTVQVCHALKISRDTFYRWIKEHKDFKEAYDWGLIACETWWENLGKMGLAGIGAKSFNTNLYMAFMKRNFRETWGAGEKDTGNKTVNFNFGQLSNTDIQKLTSEQLQEELRLRLEKHNKE